MNKKFSGLIWKILQQYVSTIIRFVISIVLARLLLPSEYGLIAEISVFIAIADVIANSSFGIAIVRKKEVVQEDYSTALFGSIILGLLLYFVIYFSAPYIAVFYDDEVLTVLLRVYGLSLFFSLYLSILNAKVLKGYDLKINFSASILSGLLSGIFAIIMAYLGLGVWALIIQTMINSFIMIIVLQIRLKWFPGIKIDFVKLKEMFSFSWKYLVASVLGTLLENIYNLSIGRYFGEETLGFYSKGNSFPSLIIGQLRTAISTIMLPFFSEKQNDLMKMKDTIRMATHFSALVMFPLAAGMAIIARPMVLVLLTEKWLPCVLFIQIECFFYAALAVSTPLGIYLSAIGKSGLLVFVEVFKLICTVLGILFLRGQEIYYLCVWRAVLSLLTIVISLIAANRFMPYSFLEIVMDIIKPLISTLIMAFVIFLCSHLSMSEIVKLIIQIAVGVGVYLFCAHLWMKEDFIFVKQLLKNR